MVECFGPEQDIRRITEADADHYRRWLLEKKYAPATIGRTLRRAQQFFRHAVRAKIVTENPFAGQKCPPQVNKDRLYFVSREEIGKLLEACPGTQWRLVFALCRF